MPIQQPQVNQLKITPQNSNLAGIGGWLILPAIGLPIGLLKILFGCYDLIKTYSVPGVLDLMTTPSTKFYVPYLFGLLTFEALINIFFIANISYAIYLFFTKSVKAPKTIILFYIVYSLGMLVDTILSMVLIPENLTKDVLGSQIGAVIGAFLTLAIWGTYFYRSERVKNTFINP
ncbi:DUF2569 domain-containing protein [Polynucleobacter paneuropaeus]|nr:DUF2569 domain-containing protein [Polynucleobacter paneuropaeus]